MLNYEVDTPWVKGWKPEFIGTLLFVVDKHRVLLIHKKTGHGAGKINGPGGKLEEGETLEACAKRELLEETGLLVKKASCRAELRFVEEDGPQWLGFAFVASSWSGGLRETEEAKPFWVDIEEIPFERMWPDDKFWLPKILVKDDEQNIVICDFLFRRGILKSHHMELVESLSISVD